MKTFLKQLLCALATLFLFVQPLHAQPADDFDAAPAGTTRPLINTAGWYPITVSFSLDETNVLTGVCPAKDESTNRGALRTVTTPRCTIMRYDIAEERWASLPNLDNDAYYTDVAYTFDGSAIFAQETAKCPVIPYVAPVRPYCNLLVLLDHTGKKIKNLTLAHDIQYLYPSLTRDGKKILFWGLSDQLSAGMGGGGWDVKELDIASQLIKQKTDYQAAFPKITPRYLKDGRIMMVAEEYPKRPNLEDFFVRLDAKTGERLYTNYVGKFGRNMTVVVDKPRAPIKPFFPANEHMWLIARDISRDGKLVLYGDNGRRMCFKFIEEPERERECFTQRVSDTPSASISSSGKTIALVNGDPSFEPRNSWHLSLIDVATGNMRRIGMRW